MWFHPSFNIKVSLFLILQLITRYQNTYFLNRFFYSAYVIWTGVFHIFKLMKMNIFDLSDDYVTFGLVLSH